MEVDREQHVTAGKQPPDPKWLRVLAMTSAILFFGYIGWLWLSNFDNPLFTDHLSFWAAGRLALGDDPASAYDIAAHTAAMRDVMPVSKMLAFPYPPPFLAVLLPFSIGRYVYSFGAWVVLTSVIYLIASRRLVSWPYAFSHPAAFVNGFFGQAGFLIAGIFLAGVRMLDKKPILGGAVLGFLVMKPHYGFLLPIAVIASRAWPAMASAAFTSIALMLASLALFGSSTFGAYLHITARYVQMFMGGGWWWQQLISPFALALYAGLSPRIAVLIHLVIALAAVVLTWIAWSRDWDEKLPILASGTLLVSPYLLTYDSLLLVAPIGYWATTQPRPYLVAFIWLLCLLPALAVVELYSGPNTIALASTISLAALAINHLPVHWPALKKLRLKVRDSATS